MARRAALIGLAASMAVLVANAPAPAQSGEDILNTAMERFEERMSGVDNYTVVQEVMGTEITSYYEKQMVDGRPVFVEKESWGEGSEEDMGEFYHIFMSVADRAKRVGTETIDGHRCHVVLVDDFSGVDLDPDTEDEEEVFQPRLSRFYLDADDYVIRKMYMEGDMRHEGEARPVDMEVLFQDYREVEGMLHPFQTHMMVRGLAGAMSDEEREEARRSLEELRERMAEMPEAQREMMESMMSGQLEQLEKMVNSGTMEITTQIKELRVNTGPPQGSN